MAAQPLSPSTLRASALLALSTLALALVTLALSRSALSSSAPQPSELYQGSIGVRVPSAEGLRGPQPQPLDRSTLLPNAGFDVQSLTPLRRIPAPNSPIVMDHVHFEDHKKRAGWANVHAMINGQLVTGQLRLVRKPHPLPDISGITKMFSSAMESAFASAIKDAQTETSHEEETTVETTTTSTTSVETSSVETTPPPTEDESKIRPVPKDVPPPIDSHSDDFFEDIVKEFEEAPPSSTEIEETETTAPETTPLPQPEEVQESERNEAFEEEVSKSSGSQPSGSSGSTSESSGASKSKSSSGSAVGTAGPTDDPECPFRTMQGCCCDFPFDFEGKSYSEPIKIGHQTAWCYVKEEGCGEMDNSITVHDQGPHDVDIFVPHHHSEWGGDYSRTKAGAAEAASRGAGSSPPLPPGGAGSSKGGNTADGSKSKSKGGVLPPGAESGAGGVKGSKQAGAKGAEGAEGAEGADGAAESSGPPKSAAEKKYDKMIEGYHAIKEGAERWWDHTEPPELVTIEDCNCQFPFTFHGVEHNTCIWKTHDTPWCLVQEDKCGQGEYTEGDEIYWWDYCVTPPIEMESGHETMQKAPPKGFVPKPEARVCGDSKSTWTEPWHFNEFCASGVCNYRCKSPLYCPDCDGGNCACVEPQPSGGFCGDGTNRPPEYSNAECLSGVCQYDCILCTNCNGGSCKCA